MQVPMRRTNACAQSDWSLDMFSRGQAKLRVHLSTSTPIVALNVEFLLADLPGQYS